MNKKLRRERRGRATKFKQKQLGLPRLVVYRSLNHIYAQVVTKAANGDVVIAVSSTVDKEVKSGLKGCKVEQAQLVGKLLAERALAKNITKVAFDRAGYKFHGRVKALAEGAREAGLNF